MHRKPDWQIRRFLESAVFALLVAGCSGNETLVPPTAQPSIATGIAVSSETAAAGDTLTVQVLQQTATGIRLGTLEGTVSFDPAALRYLGQPLAGDAPVVVNDGERDQGRVRLIALRLAGLAPVAAELRFVVQQAGYARQLQFVPREAVTSDMIVLRPDGTLPLSVQPALFDTPARRLTINDWAVHLGYAPPGAALMMAPGDGKTYGDVTLGGGINGLDVLAILNVTVGNTSVLTDPVKDLAIAGNVAPFNLPGLGEATDPNPPGRNADGSFDISGLDALALANEGVGNDQPVVGEPIPGRAPRPERVVLTDSIPGLRTFTRDTIYELRGAVIVPAGATLTIAPGTRIEGDMASRGSLVVARAGNVNWQGTRLEPIVFTCTSATPMPGCWGGVVLNGLALLNNRDPGVFGFCPEKVSIGSIQLYGGCLVEDTTGVMDYVRIEHAGQSAGAGAVAGLALLGVGSGTRIDHLQVHGSAGDGVFVSGGNVNLRHLVLTGNLGAGLGWSDGWGGGGFGGSGQFLQVQVPVNGVAGLRGANLASNPHALPISQPDLYHLTIVGSGAGGTGTGLLLGDGTGGSFRDMVLMNSGTGLDINGAESCALSQSDSLVASHSIVFGNGNNFAADGDCLDEAAYALDPARAFRTVDPGLFAPANTVTPDTRPAFGSAATTGSLAPPSNFFFDVTPTYVGAVVPAGFVPTGIPWYVGWTRGWSGAMP